MMMNREAREELYDPKKWMDWGMSYSKLKDAMQRAKTIRASNPNTKVKVIITKETPERYQVRIYDPKRKRKRSAWLSFVIAHKNMRTAKGLLDLKAISKLWKLKRGKLGK